MPACPFYRETALGRRCVLLSPEEWRALRASGRGRACEEGGGHCPFRRRAGR